MEKVVSALAYWRACASSCANGGNNGPWRGPWSRADLRARRICVVARYLTARGGARARRMALVARLGRVAGYLFIVPSSACARLLKSRAIRPVSVAGWHGWRLCWRARGGVIVARVPIKMYV